MTVKALIIHHSYSLWGNRAAIDDWHKVRGWKGIDRLLNIMLLIYVLLLWIIYARGTKRLKNFRDRLLKLLKQITVLKRKNELTEFKIMEALAFDFQINGNAWR